MEIENMQQFEKGRGGVGGKRTVWPASTRTDTHLPTHRHTLTQTYTHIYV